MGLYMGMYMGMGAMGMGFASYMESKGTRTVSISPTAIELPRDCAVSYETGVPIKRNANKGSRSFMEFGSSNGSSPSIFESSQEGKPRKMLRDIDLNVSTTEAM